MTMHEAEPDAVDEDIDEDAEREFVDTDEYDEAANREQADEPGTAAVDRTAESDPLQKLAPVGSDTAMDPGTGSYQDRCGAIQGGFIDDPRRTVASASALVTEIGDEIARGITDEREGIDGRWQSTESSTDDLRAAMQDYRALYARLARFASN
jgi:hypothetical protein